MNKGKLIDFLVWGILLWLFGYLLGIIFFIFIPAKLIGWVIMPFGILVTAWVLKTRIKDHRLQYFVALGLVWMLIAVLMDYLFIVKMLKPVGGYYKLDVYLYYLLTWLMPVILGKRIDQGNKI